MAGEKSTDPNGNNKEPQDIKYQRKKIIAKRTLPTENSQGGVVNDDVQTNSPAPKHRGRPAGWRKETDMKTQKSTKDTIVSNRCYVDVAMTFIHTQVLKKLKASHIKLLALTPFLHLFAFPRGTQCNNAALHNIPVMWDNVQKCFNFKSVKLHFTAEEVCLILGLPLKGKPVNYKRGELTTSTLRKRYFGYGQEISRHKLEEVILESIEDKESDEHIVGLLVMYLFTTILFPQSTGCVPLHLFCYVDDVADLRRWAWGPAVYNMLMDNIPSCAIWCRLMDSIQENIEESSQDEDRRKGILPGCVLAVLGWFYEHTKIEKE